MNQITKNIAIVTAFALSTSGLQAQADNRIAGSVTDSATNSFLPGSTIILKKLTGDNTSSPQALVSTQDGSFSFNSVGKGYYHVIIAANGYKNSVIDSVEISDTKMTAQLGAIKLVQNAKALGTVVVKGKQPTINYGADKITYHVGQTSLAAGSNAFELLKTAPEVIADPMSGNINVRGKSVLVTIDGKLTNLSGEDLKTYLANIPGSNVDKIEIVVNPSARYDASGGVVINIKTLRPANLGTNGSLTAGVGAGTYGRYNGSLTLNHRTLKTNIYGTANFENTAQYVTNDHDQIIDGSPTTIREAQRLLDKRNNGGFQLGLDHDINKQSSFGFLIKGNLNYRDRHLDNTSLAYSTRLSLADSSSAVSTNGKASYFTPSVNLYYKTILNKKGADLQLNADYFLYRKTWKDDFVTNYAYADNSKVKSPTYLRSNSPADNEVQSFSADYTTPVKKGKLEAGFKTTFTQSDNDILWQNRNGSSWETDAGKTNHFIYNENINAAYVSLSQRYGKYSITGGLRAEQTNTTGNLVGAKKDKNTYTNLFPNLSVMYMKSMAHIFTFNFKRSILRYGFDFVNPFIVYQSQYSYQQGNPFILPQINNSVSTSWIYKQFLSTTLTYVHNTKVLSIVYKAGSEPNSVIRSYDNLQTQDALVTSLSFSKALSNWWQLTAAGNGQYVIIKDNSAGAAGAVSKTLTSTLTTINSLALSKKLTADVTAMYMSPYVAGALHMRTIFTANAGVSLKVLNEQGSLKLNVSDLFNTLRGSYTYKYGLINSSYHVKQESRFANLVFTYKFGNNKVKDSKQRKTGVEDERTRMGTN